MSESTVKDPTRLVNEDWRNLLLNWSLESGFGFLPTENGIGFPVTVWAKLFGITDTTFTRWLKKYEIPYKKPGDTIYVRPDDLWERVPWSTEPSGGEEKEATPKKSKRRR